MYCPNQNSPEWKKQKELLGEDVAFFAWDKNNGRSLEFAPNGEKSILFDELSKEYGEKKAYDIISKTHTKEFKDWFESKGGVYSSPEYKLADKVRKILKLRGIDKSFNVSDTNYGKSMYFTVYDDSTNKLLSKIRISDHSVSNIDRIFDEQHESNYHDRNDTHGHEDVVDDHIAHRHNEEGETGHLHTHPGKHFLEFRDDKQ